MARKNAKQNKLNLQKIVFIQRMRNGDDIFFLFTSISKL